MIAGSKHVGFHWTLFVSLHRIVLAEASYLAGEFSSRPSEVLSNACAQPWPVVHSKWQQPVT